jgi:hypothetical protein
LLFRSFEVPQVWKISTLLRLDWLNRAAVPLQKDAFSRWLVHEGQPLPVQPQFRITLNKVVLADTEMRGHSGYLSLRDAYLTRPAATGRATLAF